MDGASFTGLLIFQSIIKSVAFKLPKAGSCNGLPARTRTPGGKRSLFTFKWCQILKNPSMFHRPKRAGVFRATTCRKQRSWYRLFTSLPSLWGCLAKHWHV